MRRTLWLFVLLFAAALCALPGEAAPDKKTATKKTTTKKKKKKPHTPRNQPAQPKGGNQTDEKTDARNNDKKKTDDKDGTAGDEKPTTARPDKKANDKKDRDQEERTESEDPESSNPPPGDTDGRRSLTERDPRSSRKRLIGNARTEGRDLIRRRNHRRVIEQVRFRALRAMRWLVDGKRK